MPNKQQKKYFKSFLVLKTNQSPRMHSLRELLHLVLPLAPELASFTESVNILDQYYIPTRYPDALPGSLPEGLPTAVHAQEALEIADSIKSSVVQILNKDTQTHDS